MHIKTMNGSRKVFVLRQTCLNSIFSTSIFKYLTCEFILIMEVEERKDWYWSALCQDSGYGFKPSKCTISGF